MSADQLAALGAFFSGIGSVLSAAWYVRRQKRRADDDCQKRIDEIDKALHEGLRIAHEQDHQVR